MDASSSGSPSPSPSPSRTSRKVVDRPAPISRSNLDPYGIYGARTANRRRTLQQRRQMQGYGLLAAVVALAIAIILFWQVRRVPTLDSVVQEPLQVRLTAAPVAVASATDEFLLLPTASGQLLRINAKSLGQSGHEPHSLLNVDAPLRSQPLVAGQRAFVPCEDGVLYALDWNSGRQLWRYDTGDSVTTRPARLIWWEQGEDTGEADETEANAEEEEEGEASSNATRRTVIFAGNDAGLVVALDENTGRAMWRERMPAPIGNALAVTTSRNGQPKVLVPLLAGPTGGGGLWCLDARSGRILWKFPTDPKVFAAQFGAPLVVDASTPGADMAGPASVYLANDAGAIFRLNLNNGQVIWKTFAKPLPQSGADAAVVLRSELLWKEYSGQGRRLFVGGQDGGLRCFDADKGSLIWAFEVDAPINSRPQPWPMQNEGSAGRLLIGCDDNRALILDALEGTLLARLRSDGNAFAGVLPSKRGPIIVSQKGTVQLFAPLE